MIDVWDVPTRLFHWALVASIATAWFSGGSGAVLHETVGYVAAGLIGFRLIWGLVGTRHARFSDFVTSPFAVLRYLGDVIRMRAPRHIGHNPAGGAMILVLIAVVIVLAVTGAMLQSDAFFGIMWVETMHETTANALLVLIPLHIFGVIVSSLAHRENLIAAMFSGRKPVHRDAPQTAETAGAEVSDFQGGRDTSIRQQLHGLHGLILLIMMVGGTGLYGWSTTSERTVIIESQPPVESEPTAVERSVAKNIQSAALSGDSQDYVAGGPAIASHTWLISSGGRLYDNWYRALGKAPPSLTHPSWPADNKTVTGGETWRCKSCHGWDYLGRDGQYRTGANATGIAGIRRSQGRPISEIIAVLGNATHAMTDDLIPPHAKYRLAVFVSEGQHTIDRYIDRDGYAKASPREGAAVFQNVCAACHGFNGKARRLSKSRDPAHVGPGIFVGTIAQANPVEMLHKIRNGHPGAAMVSMRAFPMTYSTRLLAYVQTLPIE